MAMSSEGAAFLSCVSEWRQDNPNPPDQLTLTEVSLLRMTKITELY